MNTTSPGIAVILVLAGMNLLTPASRVPAQDNDNPLSRGVVYRFGTGRNPAFLNPSLVSLDRRGQVWAAASRTGPILVFSQSGDLVDSLAAPPAIGFRGIASLAVLGDTLYVLDQPAGQDGRILAFTGGGELTGIFPLQGTDLPPPYEIATPNDFLYDRSMLAFPPIDARLLLRLPARTVPITRIAPNGTRLGGLGTAYLPSSLIGIALGRDTSLVSFAWHQRLFNRSPLWRLAPDRRHLVFVRREPDTVAVRTVDVRTGQSVQWPALAVSKRAVPSGLRDSLLREARAAMRQRAIPDSISERIVQRHIPLPEYFPSVFDMVVGVDRNVLLQITPSTEPTIAWQLLSSNGRRLQEFRLPSGTKPLMVSTSHLWVVERSGPESASLVRLEVRER